MPAPVSAAEFLSRGTSFREQLRKAKQNIDEPEGGWYPFESLTALPVLADLLAPVFGEVMAAVASGPMLDLGCADGDLAMLFASWDIPVDAIDHAPNNFNRMLGVNSLVRSLALPVRTHDLDLDERFKFPPQTYGLALFLGTLYHLKSPYYLLEKLAFHTHWCLLSTRIAQVTPRSGARMESEPLAYLADGREIGGDATNYWIFSASGLLRIVQRTRWAVRGMKRVGCLDNSNPIAAEADERMFLLLQSRVFDPDLQVRPVSGWHEPEHGEWRWTEKSFTLDVVLPLGRHFSEFSLDIYVAGTKPVTLTCRIGEELCGSMTWTDSGAAQFRAALPAFALHEPVLRLDFSVESEFSSDGRELGICVPLNAGAIPLTVC